MQQTRRDDERTGSDLPKASGEVSDDDVAAIGRDRKGPTGQDHSTERHEITDPDHGVGEFQDREDTTSDIAHFKDEEL